MTCFFTNMPIGEYAYWQGHEGHWQGHTTGQRSKMVMQGSMWGDESMKQESKTTHKYNQTHLLFSISILSFSTFVWNVWPQIS